MKVSWWKTHEVGLSAFYHKMRSSANRQVLILYDFYLKKFFRYAILYQLNQRNRKFV